MRRITTISLPDNLHLYAQTSIPNLSKFVQDAIIMHSGRENQSIHQEIDSLNKEIEELRVELSIKQSLLKNKQAELGEQQEQQERERIAEEAKLYTCMTCETKCEQKELRHYLGYCKNCWSDHGARKTLSDKKVAKSLLQ